MTNIRRQALLFFSITSFLHVVAQNETEPNGTTSTANVMGATIYGAIQSAGDYDVFSFQVNQPGVLSMGVTQVPSNLKLTIHMLDPLLRQWVTVSSTVGGGSVSFKWNACDMGKYYIRIFEPYGSNSVSQYKVTAALDISDIYECNNNFDSAKTIALNQPINAYINSDGDRDYFLMTMPDTGLLNLAIPNPPSIMRMVLYVYDSTRTLVKQTAVPTYSGTPVSLSTAVKKGKHYIVVEDDNYNSSTTAYTLNSTFSIVTPVSDIPNQSTSIKIFPNPSKGNFRIDISNIPYRQQNEITLINSSGQVVATIPIQFSGIIHFNRPLAVGTYWIRVKTKENIFTQKVFITN